MQDDRGGLPVTVAPRGRMGAMGGNGRKALGLAAAVGLLGLAAWAGASWLQERQQFEANLDTIVGLLAIPEHAKPRAVRCGAPFCHRQ